MIQRKAKVEEPVFHKLFLFVAKFLPMKSEKIFLNLKYKQETSYDYNISVTLRRGDKLRNEAIIIKLNTFI